MTIALLILGGVLCFALGAAWGAGRVRERQFDAFVQRVRNQTMRQG